MRPRSATAINARIILRSTTPPAAIVEVPCRKILLHGERPNKCEMCWPRAWASAPAAPTRRRHGWFTRLMRSRGKTAAMRPRRCAACSMKRASRQLHKSSSSPSSGVSRCCGIWGSGAAKTPKHALALERQRRIAAESRQAASKPVVTLAHYRDWLPLQPMADLLLTDPPYATDVPDIVSFARDWLPLTALQAQADRPGLRLCRRLPRGDRRLPRRPHRPVQAGADSHLDLPQYHRSQHHSYL